MAIVLDVNFLCNKLIDVSAIKTLLNRYKIKIECMKSIDNWMWENEKKVESFKQIPSILDSQHIVIIYLKQPSIKDVGVYIERVENRYHYTLWINTDGYPMLDCERITKDNCKYYKKLIQAILELNGLIEDSFEAVGIGLETEIGCGKKIIDIIQNSKNIIIWLINKHIELYSLLDEFEAETMKDIYIFYKKDEIME